MKIITKLTVGILTLHDRVILTDFEGLNKVQKHIVLKNARRFAYARILNRYRTLMNEK